MTAVEKATATAFLAGLQAGGLLCLELAEDARTGKHVLMLTAETKRGKAVELVIHPAEVQDLATDLLILARDCQERDQDTSKEEKDVTP